MATLQKYAYIILSFLFLLSYNSSFGQVASTLENDTFLSCEGNLPTTTLNLGNFTISETVATDFSITEDTGTIFYLKAPSNFEFTTAPETTTTGGDITNISAEVVDSDNTLLKITYTVSANATLDVITFENLSIKKAIGSANTTNGTLQYSLEGNTNTINALSDNDTLATVSFTTLNAGTGVNQSVCGFNELQNIRVTNAVSTTLSRTYQWEQLNSSTNNWSAISGATSEVLEKSSLTTLNGVASYRRVTTFTLNGETCIITSTPAEITINEIDPGSITEGLNQNICATENPSLLSSNGDPATTIGSIGSYQWYLYNSDDDDWDEISGATEETYLPINLSETSTFKRRVTSTLNGLTCFAETNSVTVTVNDAVVGGDAQSSEVCANTSVTIVVSNATTAGTLSYQWQKSTDGVSFTNIDDATNATLTLTTVPVGTTYYKRIIQKQGTTCQGVSSVAVISNANFAPGTISGDETICSGDTPATLQNSDTANSEGNVSYQWESRTASISFAAISGATENTYSPAALTETSFFRRKATSTYNGNTCEDFSNTVTITVNSIVTGGTTENQNLCSNNLVQPIVVNNATTSGALTYQWEQSTNNTLFTEISGATEQTYTPTTLGSGSTFFRRITRQAGADCEGISDVAEITVSNFVVGSISDNQTICNGTAPNQLIGVPATSEAGTLSYQWVSSSDNSTFTAISGANGINHSPTNLTQTTYFKRIDSNVLNGNTCEAETNVVVITVNSDVLGGAASSQSICSLNGLNTIEITGATTSSNPTYTWEISRDDLTFETIPGVTTPSYKPTVLNAGTTYFRRITTISGVACSGTSSSGSITFNNFSVGTISADETICSGETPAQLVSTADANGEGILAYQWVSSTDNNNFNPISGATSANYSPEALTQTTYFKREDTSTLNTSVCSQFTNTVTVTVNTAISGGTIIDQSACAPSEVTALIVTGASTGTDISYQWERSSNGTDFTTIPGETNSNFTPTITSGGTFYFRRITKQSGASCEGTSTVATVTVNDFTVGSISGDTNICSGTTPNILLSVSDASGEGTIAYQWQSASATGNFSDITSATNANYQPGTLTETTRFKRIDINTLNGYTCTAETNSITVSVTAPVNGGTTQSQNICTSSDLQLITVTGGETGNYRWEELRNGTWTTISGENANSLDVSGRITAGVSQYRRVTTVPDASCEGISTIATITFNNFSKGSITGTSTVCYNTQNITLLGTDATGSGTLSYQWEKSTDNNNYSPITGATGTSYTITNAIETATYRRVDKSTLNGNSCEDNTNDVTITVIDEIEAGTASANQTVCETELPAPITISDDSASTIGTSYQWQSATNGTFTNMVGQTGASLSFATTPTQTTSYRRTTFSTTNGIICSDTSTSSTVFVNTLTVGSISDNQNICAGETPAVLSAITPTTAEGVLTHQWEQSTDGTNWSSIVDANNTTYAPPILSETTSFRRIDTSTLNTETCSEETNSITITVAGIIAGGTGSLNQTVCVDDIPSELTVTDGTAPDTGITYQWYSSADDDTYVPLAGKTGETLVFSTSVAETTYFKRLVQLNTNGNICEAFSTPTLVTLISIDAGELSTTNPIVCETGLPEISATDATSNGNITYQWQSSTNGEAMEDIAGATQANYTATAPISLATTYQRIATSTLNSITCTATTIPLTIAVNRFENGAAHEITFSDGATGTQTVCDGGDAAAFGTNFVLITTGDAIAYRWESSTDNANWSTISGATNATYDPPVVTETLYYRRVSTTTLDGVSCDELVSNTLTVLQGGNATAGTIATTNSNSTDGLNTELEVICAGGDPSEIIETEAATGATLTYQWFVNDAEIVGATLASYDPPAGLTNTAVYMRRTTSTTPEGVTCDVDSNTVTVLVPQADDLGADITVCDASLPGDLGNVSSIEGDDYLTYQWYQSNDGITYQIIATAQDAVYTPTTPFTADKFYRRDYVATIAGEACTTNPVESSILKVSVNKVTSAGSITGNQEICFDGDASELQNSALGSGTGDISYQWYLSENNTDWSFIPDAVFANYDPPAGLKINTYFKRATISTLNGVACEDDSNAILVGVASELTAGILEENQTVCVGEDPNELFVSNGSTFDNQTYAWFSSPDNNIWTDLGITTASYDPSVLANTTFYKRETTRVENGVTCIVATNAISVTVNKIEAGEINGEQEICFGDQPLPLTDRVTPFGTGEITYQWVSSVDNQTYSPVPNGNEINYTPPSTLPSNTYFKRIVTSTINGVACSDETSPILITVTQYPIIADQAILENDLSHVSCYGASDGSITIPSSRITGGNSAQQQIATLTIAGTTENGTTYTVFIDGKQYQHNVTLNSSNVPQTNSEIAAALATTINAATGATLSPVDASVSDNNITLSAKTVGTAFTVFASTGTATNATITTVTTQANNVGNTYEWIKIGDPTFNSNSLSISDLTAGVYQLTVFNNACGTTSEPFTITEPDALTLTIADTCNAAMTVTSTGGNAPFTYTLTKPDNSSIVQTTNNRSITYPNLIGGSNYTVTIQDATCSVTVSEQTTLPLGLQLNEASIEIKDATCFGQNDGEIRLDNLATTITGGQAPYNYSWVGPNNVGYSTANIENLTPGVYNLTVTDQIGCSATYTANVASKAALEITSVQITNENLQCAGDTDASISIQVASDVSSQLQINWYKNGSSFESNVTSLSGLGKGIYEVIITDTNSNTDSPCTVSETIEITAPEVFDAIKVSDSNPLCYEETARGTFVIKATGGTLPYQYTIDNGTPIDSNATDIVINTLITGEHTITVTDSNGCVVKTFLHTTQLPMPIEITLDTENSAAIDCNDTGAISIIPTGGSGNYFYAWQGPDYSLSGQGLTTIADLTNAGTYTVTVFDSNQCSTQQSFVLNDDTQSFSIEGTVTQPTCAQGFDSASILLNLSSAVIQPFTVEWETWAPKDANDTDCLVDCYEWQRLPNEDGKLQLNNLAAGRYKVTVTDSSLGACNTVTKTYTIDEPTLEIVQASLLPISCDVAKATYSFELLRTNPVGFYLNGTELSLGRDITFNNTTNKYTVANLSSGDYSLRIVEKIPNDTTTVDGCDVSANFTVAGYQTIAYGGAKLLTLDICSTAFPFELDVAQVGGGAPFIGNNNEPSYLYSWTGPNGFRAQDITSFAATAGTYELIITDSENCASDPIEFTFKMAFDPISVSKVVTPVSCDAENDGLISITIAGGKRPYSILWEAETPGNSANNNPTYTTISSNNTLLNGLSEGRYRLTVTSDFNGCTQNNTEYFYQEIITINKSESLQLLDGPYQDQALCEGTPGTLTIDIFNSQPGAISFYYNNALVTATKISATTYEVQIPNPVLNTELNAVNALGCGFTTEINAGVNDPSFTYTSNEFEVTGSILTSEEVRFTNTTETGYRYATWDFGDGTGIQTVFPDDDGIGTTHTYNFAGIFTTTVTVYNEQGCSKSFSQDIRIGKGYDVIFPNVFSANGDGINDIFQGEMVGIASFTFEIYDMWGGLITTNTYEYSALPAVWGWDGNYSSGEPYIQKSFRYVFIGTSSEGAIINKTGEAVILR